MDEKELVKVTVGEALKPFADLIERLFGGAIDEIGGMWQDSLKARRMVRQCRILQSIKEEIEEAGFSPQTISDRIWMPAMQSASMEDSADLQDKWASLLTNAADPRQIQKILPSFTSILSDLSPFEAAFLDVLYDRLQTLVCEGAYKDGTRVDSIVIGNKEQLREMFLKIVRDKTASLALTLDNLLRLRLIDVEVANILVNGQPIGEQYMVTELGHAFVSACRPPKRSSSPTDPASSF
jgi:hypothetical protein